MGPQLFRLAEAVTAHNQHRSLTVLSIKCGVQAINNPVTKRLNVPNPDEFAHYIFQLFKRHKEKNILFSF